MCFNSSMCVFVQGSVGRKGSRGLSGAAGVEVSISHRLNPSQASHRQRYDEGHDDEAEDGSCVLSALRDYYWIH